MTLRSDKSSGLLTCAAGLGLVVFSLFGLCIISIQRVMLMLMPPMPPLETGATPQELFDVFHSLWLTFMPMLLLGGLVLGVAGYYVRQGSTLARRIAQTTLVCGYFWLAAYCAAIYKISDILAPPTGLMSKAAEDAATAIGLGFSAVVLSVLPTALLFVLSRPKTTDAIKAAAE